MGLHDHLTMERRARLAAERLLAQRQEEFREDNRRISEHARFLVDEIVFKREEAEELRTENVRVRTDLEQARTAVEIAERRLWDSVEAIDDGLGIFDSRGVLLAANAAFLRPFDGMDEAGPGATHVRLLELAVEEGIVDIGSENRVEWCARMAARWRSPAIPDAVVRFWNGRSARLIDRRTRDGDIVSLALDITRDLRREGVLRRARDRAEAATRAKSAFLANMSHEIRTPMNGVVGMADILMETALTDEQRLYAETIRNSGEALLTIINDVLDYSKIEAGRMTLKLADFDLEELLLEVVRLLAPKAREKGLKITLDYDMFLPERFNGDAGRIRQVVTNLLGNAVKFTETGGITLRALGLPAGPGRRHVTLMVEDTGIGIPAEAQEHIFGSFNQVDDATTRAQDGTGLGLAITRDLVTLMDGRIWVESKPGEGSAFGIRLTLPEAPTLPEVEIPEGLDRAFVVGGPAGIDSHLVANLCALGLPVVSFDPRTKEASRPGPSDILVLTGPAMADPPRALDRVLSGTVGPALVLGIGSGAAPDLSAAPCPARALPEPASRHALARALSEARPMPAAAAPPAETAPTAAPRPLKVLAAEDNKTNRLVLSRMLKDLQIDLKIAEDGEAALEAYDADPPDILFTDISMPRRDGVSLMREVRRRAGLGAPVRVYAMTAHAAGTETGVMDADEFDGYLTKPLRKADLVAAMEASAPDDCLEISPSERPPAR